MAKVSRGDLLRIGKGLGIDLPEEEYDRLLTEARRADDPEAFLRDFAGAKAPAERSEPDPSPPAACPSVPVPLPTVSVTAPIASDCMRDGVQHVQIFFREEPHLVRRLEQLFEGLDRVGARLQGRTAGETPRRVASRADALKWLLENLA